MSYDVLSLNNFQDNKNINIQFGDLTVLHESDCKISNLLLKTYMYCKNMTIIDNEIIMNSKRKSSMLELYFGNVKKVLGINVQCKINKHIYDLSGTRINSGLYEYNSFHVPSNRILSINDNRLKYYSEFSRYELYPICHFSNVLMNFLVKHPISSIFPLDDILINDVKDKSLFKHMMLLVNKIFVDIKYSPLNQSISSNDEELQLWTSVQQFYFLLFLSMYYVHVNKIKTIIIEEPEIGLDENMIKIFMYQVFALLAMNHNVIISTKSKDIMEYFDKMKMYGMSKSIFINEMKKMFLCSSGDSDIILNEVASKNIAICHL